VTQIFSSFLVFVYPKLLWLALSGWIACLPFAVRRLTRRLAETRPGTARLLFAIALGALVIRLAAPAAHRVFYDEFEHLDAARHLAASGAFAETLAGGWPGWTVLTAPTWPGGHHAALAAVFFLFGSGTNVAFAWSALLGGVTVLFVFWAALELFGEERGALAVAAVWACIPLAVRYSSACDLTSASLFWTAAALASLHARESAPGPAADAFFALSLAYAVQVRPENALLIGYAALVVSRRVLLLPALAGLLVPAALAVANRVSGLPGYSAATTAPLEHLFRQILPNLVFLSAPAAFSLILLPGVVLGLNRTPVRRLLLLAAAYLVLYCCFFRGRFDAGSEDRYALSVMLPLAVAAAAGLARAATAACLLSVGLLWLSPRESDARDARLRRFAAAAAPQIPDGVFVAAFNPSAALELFHRPAAAAYLILEDPAGFARERARIGADPRVALYEDWAWRSRPEDAERLERTLTEGRDASVLAADEVDRLILLTPRR
jgi:hypothetical protein